MSARLAPAHAPNSDGAERLVHVVQGEYKVVTEPNVVLSTILGSCVAMCLRDPLSGIGGMNHFLLPGDEDTASDSVKYGVNAMDLLINGLLQRGALRQRMEAKLFGGAAVVHNLGEIGAKNAAFALKFLHLEGITCVSQSLGGDRARRVRYWPATGRASQLLLDPSQSDVFAKERQVAPPAAPKGAGSIELF